MQPDEIREIREMEARIAEMVMGWTNLKPPPPNKPSLSWQGKPPAGTSTHYLVPEYARLIEKAWRIVERLQREGFNVMINASGGMDWDTCVELVGGDGRVFHTAEDPSPALAICAAALDWAERRKEAGDERDASK